MLYAVTRDTGGGPPRTTVVIENLGTNRRGWTRGLESYTVRGVDVISVLRLSPFYFRTLL